MRYSFADCVLDTQLYTLSRAGTTCPLRPKVFQVLVYLLTHRDHVVSREELCAQVWPGQFISETTLESCIKRTRQAIGDSGHMQRYGHDLLAASGGGGAGPGAYVLQCHGRIKRGEGVVSGRKELTERAYVGPPPLLAHDTRPGVSY
jgi:Transcriptional regulatory protein, C terminal